MLQLHYFLSLYDLSSEWDALYMTMDTATGTLTIIRMHRQKAALAIIHTRT
jgi:hypothetical protein